MKNASEVSLKIDGCEISRCELLENYRPDISDNDFAFNGNGSFVNQKAASASARYEAETARKIDKSIVYMRQHLDKPLQASVLATLVNISTSHFFALFKRKTGYSPMNYFNLLRMHQACHLLNTTAMSVKEIALTLGYKDPLYFSRLFKLINGTTPTEYRTMRQKVARLLPRIPALETICLISPAIQHKSPQPNQVVKFAYIKKPIYRKNRDRAKGDKPVEYSRNLNAP